MVPVMNKPKLSDAQKQQIDDLISETILPALCNEDGVCDPDMSDMKEDHPDYDQVWEDRMTVLYLEALTYLKNNLI